MSKGLWKALLLVILSFPLYVFAELPLQVEDLLSDKGKFRFELSTTYANSETRGADVSNSISVQTGDTTFVDIPIQIGEHLTNTDILITTIGMRYGLSSKSNIYTRASALSGSYRSESSIGIVSKTHTSNFVDAWLGMSYKFWDDTDKPALLGFSELQIAEHQSSGSTVYNKSIVAGVTSYQTYDPIVLSLTSAVQLNTTRKNGGENLKIGNSLVLSPSVGFAVNDKVTLTTGLNWRIKQADKINNQQEGIKHTQTNLDMGLGYALGKYDTLNVNVRSKISGNGDAQVNMNWIHRLKTR